MTSLQSAATCGDSNCAATSLASLPARVLSRRSQRTVPLRHDWIRQLNETVHAVGRSFPEIVHGLEDRLHNQSVNQSIFICHEQFDKTNHDISNLTGQQGTRVR